MYIYSTELTHRIKLSNKTYESEMLPYIKLTNDLDNMSISEARTHKTINTTCLGYPNCFSRLGFPDKI